MTVGAGDRRLAPAQTAAPDPRLEAAELRRRAALEEVDALDAEVDRLAAELSAFSGRYESGLSGPFSELADAERLVRRLQALEDELARLAGLLERPPPRPASRRPARSRSRAPDPAAEAVDQAQGGAEAEADGDVHFEVAAEEVELKRLHRRLARLYHPDLSADGEERERLSALMARVNEAYTRGDRAALELLAERGGAGGPDGELSPDERLAHAERRAASLAGIALALRRDRDRLLASDTARLWKEARRRAEQGGDLVAEMRRDLETEAEEARADARRRLERVYRGAAAVERRWRSAMNELVLRGGKGLRPFDPLSESPLVRRGVLRLERARAGAAARALARALEEAAERAPWEAAATLLAFFAEAARRPPESLATAEGWRQRWEELRRRWPEAPDFERLLSRLPRHLELGLRAVGGDLAAGLQLASAEHPAGVRIALGREPVARLARDVLGALGPTLRCPRCRRERAALHLLRTRGLDEVHAMVCPRCGGVLRSYWRYGEAEGLEALAPLALDLGLVSEQVVRLGGASIAFQMLPPEREALTAGRLGSLFAELYLVPCKVDVAPVDVRFRVGRALLRRAARLPQRGVTVEVGGTSGVDLEEALRARIARRFRPASGN